MAFENMFIDVETGYFHYHNPEVRSSSEYYIEMITDNIKIKMEENE